MFRYISVASFLLVCCLNGETPPQINLGVESILKNKDGTYNIHVYMLNQVPLAGFQLDILPKGLFEIESIHDGRGAEAGFNMSAGKTGTMLGFSFTGSVINISKSDDPADNLLFTLTVKLLSKLPEDPVSIGFVVIMAGSTGEKIPAEMIEYSYDFTPEKR